jgi:hypothetical protein
MIGTNKIKPMPSWRRHCFEQDKFEGIKEVIRSRKWNDRQYNGQKEKKTNGQTMIYKTLHRKLKKWA